MKGFGGYRVVKNLFNHLQLQIVKSYILSNDTGEYEITMDDYQQFHFLVQPNVYLYNSKIYTDTGWQSVAFHLEDFLQKSISKIDNQFRMNSALKEYFYVHLFGSSVLK